MTSEGPNREPNAAGHEPVSVSARALMLGVAGLILLIVVVFAVTFLYERWLESPIPEDAERETQPSVTAVPSTRLEPKQRAQRLRYERRQRELLERYEELDDAARIPIERAMELVEKKYESPNENGKAAPQ